MAKLHPLWQIIPMRLNLLLCLALASSGLGQRSSPPSANADMADALKSATLPFSVTAQGDLAGIGGKTITDAIDQARFVLLGESHFSRETPEFAAAVCRTMHPDAYAVKRDRMPQHTSKPYQEPGQEACHGAKGTHAPFEHGLS